MFRYLGTVIGRSYYGSSRLLPTQGPTPQIIRSLATYRDPPVNVGFLENQALNEPQNNNERRFAQALSVKSRLGTSSVPEGGCSGPNYNEQAEQNSEESRALKAAFFKIVRDGQPDQVMNALLDHRFYGLVESLPQSIFVEVFRLLSPAYFIEPFRKIYRPLHPAAVDVKGYKSLELIFDEFVNNLGTVIQIRRAAGHTLGLAEYTHLLDCARALGYSIMAEHVWDAMKEDKVVPDAQCYNYYMESKVWDMAYTGREKYHLRLVPHSYRKRRAPSPSDGWQGFRTALQSVRKEVLQVFDKMTQEGTFGDETAFVNVILASGRVGHTTGMKNVLKAVWNVDVDALVAQVDESSLPPATNYDRSSPLYPTSQLLFAIAHAFGTNNDIPGALRAIEFISSSYNIAVPDNVWHELLERTFVLSRPRFGPDAKRNATGQVSFEFLSSMFEIMTSEPFNVRPTMETYHILAKTAWDRQRLSEFRRYMQAAYEILLETRRKRRTARSIVETYFNQPSPHGSQRLPRRKSWIDPAQLESRAFAEAVYTYDVLRMHTAQQTIIMERIAKLLLINHRWVGRNNPVWERNLLPRALEEWQDFLPERVTYSTRGGLVRFETGTGWNQLNVNTHGRIPVRRPTVDNGIEFDEEAWELDDDFVWVQYPSEIRSMQHPVLRRLFWGIDQRTSHPVNITFSEDEELEIYGLENMDVGLPYDMEEAGTTTNPRTNPRRPKEEEEEAFETAPGPFSFA